MILYLVELIDRLVKREYDKFSAMRPKAIHQFEADYHKLQYAICK